MRHALPAPVLPTLALTSLSLLAACNKTAQQTTSSTQTVTASSTATTASSASGEAAPASAATTSGTAASSQPVTLRVGATPVPAGELLEFVKPKLAQQGINLVVTEFTDYVTPNTALGEGSLDANLFQSQSYMDTFQADRPLNIVAVRDIYLPPLGLYSKKVTRLADLPDGATIAVPNDPTNEGRALLMLQKGGLLTLKPEAATDAGLNAITENPHHFKFLELEAPQLPRSLPDTDASIVNANYALEVGLSPAKDAILHEDKGSPYVNVLATTADKKNDPSIQRLADALTTPEVRDWLQQKYSGSVIPVF
ncbi:MetQ/NlpA family ABC transporter substrate-binding protein [Deinococcus sp. Marseille-Q6407]|uniref:MetQ/NlpA family ABC transporter substrate-binding protein n=1 Tax=Deinococcus sp. Marseille-Q6407 TaxID=2969223 RepID=UPI0021C1EBE1|nr:MetQ/NlpA family ABC transporter substrate-binding protein [Deinococcus sp. Marseille-Q6407]